MLAPLSTMMNDVAGLAFIDFFLAGIGRERLHRISLYNCCGIVKSVGSFPELALASLLSQRFRSVINWRLTVCIHEFCDNLHNNDKKYLTAITDRSELFV
jgi:hypothetical protein